MDQIAALLRGIATALGQPTVRQLALEPITREVFRITVQYGSSGTAPRVATVCRHINGMTLEVIYAGHFHNRPVTRTLDASAYEMFVSAIRGLKFDTLADHRDALEINADLWFLERGAGSFTKSLLINANTAAAEYAQIKAQVLRLIPEIVRELPLPPEWT